MCSVAFSREQMYRQYDHCHRVLGKHEPEAAGHLVAPLDLVDEGALVGLHAGVELRTRAVPSYSSNIGCQSGSQGGQGIRLTCRATLPLAWEVARRVRFRGSTPAQHRLSVFSLGSVQSPCAHHSSLLLLLTIGSLLTLALPGACPPSDL